MFRPKYRTICLMNMDVECLVAYDIPCPLAATLPCRTYLEDAWKKTTPCCNSGVMLPLSQNDLSPVVYFTILKPGEFGHGSIRE